MNILEFFEFPMSYTSMSLHAIDMASFLEKVYFTPSTIDGYLLYPLTYKTRYSTPQTIKNHLNNPLTRF